MSRVQAVALLSGWLLLAACSAGSDESCALPRPVLSSSHAAPGEQVTVTINLSVACLDTNHPGPSVPPRTWRGVTIDLVEGGRQTRLATVDSDPRGKVSAVVTVPTDAAPGRAAIRVDFAEEAALTID
ncbi:hypothetical protein [Oryzihumus leptocrescens]|uniref:Ig-like domain-containing protein n=1 Tax=Oryzihumus leptocrescens TaxID=297536 RepID=A0A542Z9N0_9MICO|nr:hypothetical protein [Oryzihumus leptocrescens]TQL57013.1 hypothetical protein FB474_3782 [Oryzihumus leptocrescens]